MPEKAKACPECNKVFDIPKKPGWWLKSNNEITAKNKKELANVAFSSVNERKPNDDERKAWTKENKDDIEREKVDPPKCLKHPDTQLSEDWQGFTIILDPTRSEVARALGIEESGSYALKVRHQ
jgi:DNA-directed RNA polymerase subunit E"|tara:strand:+ start:43 stop:414 length:372 start_codon:yes stop_codon:yes gene_type:complete